MKNFLINNSYALWLGISLGVFDIKYDDWPFYFILVPTVILIGISRKHTMGKSVEDYIRQSIIKDRNKSNG